MTYMSVKMRIWLFCLVVAAVVTTGCNIADDNDICCHRGAMTYRLTHNGIDYFDEKITHMECYLFSADDGHFMGKLYPSELEPNKVDIGTLPEGNYGMIAVANLDDYGSTDHEAGMEEEFGLRASQPFRTTRALANGDHIYWGAKRFSVVAGADNDYVTELSNIHCTLKVMVEWEGLPPGSGDYYIQLSGVYDGYCLFPGECNSMGEKLFPEYDGMKRSMVEDETLLNMSLYTELTTLRYTDNDIPAIRVWHGSTPLTKVIELKDAFRQWGWHPDAATVQEYELHLLIYRDGSVLLSPKLEVGVNDWVNGGIFY